MHKTTKKGYPQSVVYFKNELNKKKIESLKGHVRNTFTLIYFFQFFLRAEIIGNNKCSKVGHFSK